MNLLNRKIMQNKKGAAKLAATAIGDAGVGALGIGIMDGAGLALGVGLGMSVVRRMRHRGSMRGYVVLITGGSRGLGLRLAQKFAREGCRLAICARNHD